MNAPRLFRLVGHLEGASYRLLLFVAVPLKYFQGLPVAVRVAGPVHGVLFFAYLVLLTRLALENGWRAGTTTKAVGAALVPFGMFFLLPDTEETPGK